MAQNTTADIAAIREYLIVAKEERERSNRMLDAVQNQVSGITVGMERMSGVLTTLVKRTECLSDEDPEKSVPIRLYFAEGQIKSHEADLKDLKKFKTNAILLVGAALLAASLGGAGTMKLIEMYLTNG